VSGTAELEQLSMLLPDGTEQQFRLVRLQTFNWGTFTGLVDIPVSEDGFLFLGPSGSGKSTLLDAHTALLTPPKWLNFNVAAKEAERGIKDRNAMTYVRGAWAQQTSDSGETVKQFLRAGTTWSAVAETYRTRTGKTVVLGQVYWIRGKSTANSDVKKLFLVIERAFDIRELEFFAESDFDVRRLKRELPDIFVRDEFSAYQERFRRVLGIDNERALRLLHKTQSAKDLGDLNVFLRDFMLDEPATMAIADRLVAEFGELSEAHRAVVEARRQIETLTPARAEWQQHQNKSAAASKLEEVSLGVDMFKAQKHKALLEKAIATLKIEVEALEEEAIQRSRAETQARQALRDLEDRRADAGGATVERLQQELAAAEVARDASLEKRRHVAAACSALNISVPDNAAGFVHLVDIARDRIANAEADSEALTARRDELRDQKLALERRLEEVVREVRAMERNRSNIPHEMLAIRDELCAALRIEPAAVPFAGELVEVRDDCKAWRGAVERVLHGLALSLLVEDKYYGAVSNYLNQRHFGGQRLVYLRMLPHTPAAKPLMPNALPRKLRYAESTHGEWVREEIGAYFAYECADSMQAFRTAHRAVTMQGQVKHGPSRHEKDDRYAVDDRRRWILGFDNAERLAVFKSEAGEVGAALSRIEDELRKLKDRDSRQRVHLLAWNTLVNARWTEIDVATALGAVAGFQKRIAEELASRPELSQLDADIRRQQGAVAQAESRYNETKDALRRANRGIEEHQDVLEALAPELVNIALTPTQRNALDERYERLGIELTLKNLDNLTTQVVRAISAEEREIQVHLKDLQASIESRLADFARSWPAESGGLDPKLPSAGDFFAKLQRLETDGLAKYEDKFFNLLREQSDQNLTLLASRLEQEQKGILDRLELVNDSLLGADYNPGTYLVIQPESRNIEDVRQFKQDLRAALSHSLSGADFDRAVAEQRFAALSAIVKRLASLESADRSWRALVLDVRQHVDFTAREMSRAGIEVEVYKSGAGKSGGQRQKLAASCLAAALRYQLGGQDRALPSFSTVVLDEAFDRADADFTRMAMNIFRTFGFQMVVATPLKHVMTLEPFIGGACFVHIKDRRNSALLMIDYVPEKRRLDLPAHLHDEQAVTA
jgi:uncharacterized protein YPO0396